MEVNGFLGGKEEEEDGGDGVVVGGMVEEMEERKVEELVVKVVEMEGRGWPAKEATFLGCCWRSLLAGNGEGRKEKNERERKEVDIYKGEV